MSRTVTIVVPARAAVSRRLDVSVGIYNEECYCCSDGRMCCTPNCCDPEYQRLLEMRVSFAVDLVIEGDKVTVRDVRRHPDEPRDMCPEVRPPFVAPPEPPPFERVFEIREGEQA